jgi:hypothetical protein
MLFITIKKHNAVVNNLLSKIDLFKQCEEARKDNQKNNDSLVKILEKLTESNLTFKSFIASNCVIGSCELKLPDNVPVYVDDYFGGRVIKQEAMPVTILDENGKATYGLTKRQPDKGKSYILITK